MRESDKRAFAEALKELEGVYGKPVDAPGAYWRILSPYSLEEVQAAIDTHLRKSQWMPKPSELVANIQGVVQRLGADEAWGRALAASDESETVVWTDEIAEAWWAALPIWQSGDEIGARMAFREAYNRITRDRHVPPRVQVSIGHDTQRRAEVLIDAVARGLLTSDHPAVKMLPSPEGDNSVARLMDGTAKILRLGGSSSGEDEKQVDFAAKFREAISRGISGEA